MLERFSEAKNYILHCPKTLVWNSCKYVHHAGILLCIFNSYNMSSIFGAAKPRSRHRACELVDSVLVLVFLCQSRFVRANCICSLQVLDRSFYLCVFVCVLFVCVSAYICMFLTFSVRSFGASAALAFCKCCCRKATNILEKLYQNPSKIHQNGSQNPLRSVPRGLLESSWAILGPRWPQEGSKSENV